MQVRTIGHDTSQNCHLTISPPNCSTTSVFRFTLRLFPSITLLHIACCVLVSVGYPYAGFVAERLGWRAVFFLELTVAVPTLVVIVLLTQCNCTELPQPVADLVVDDAAALEAGKSVLAVPPALDDGTVARAISSASASTATPDDGGTSIPTSINADVDDMTNRSTSGVAAPLLGVADGTVSASVSAAPVAVIQEAVRDLLRSLWAVIREPLFLLLAFGYAGNAAVLLGTCERTRSGWM